VNTGGDRGAELNESGGLKEREVLVFNGSAVARMPQDASVEAWPMSSIPSERSDPKRWD
jgi:hypothetical protein